MKRWCAWALRFSNAVTPPALPATSLLLPDGALLATPTGSCLGELQADRLSKVSLNGDWLSGDKPSKEISFHRALYLNNPECKAVVHLHCTYLTALSCLQGLDVDNAIKPFTPMW